MTRLSLKLLKAISALPTPLIGMLGYAVGSLLWWLGRGRVTDTNLRLCFPDMPRRERARIGRWSMMRLTRSFLELGVQAWQPKSRTLDRVRLLDTEHLTAHLGKRPVIVLMPHFVGINAGGVRFSEDWRCLAMYSANKDEGLDAMIRLGRERYGGPILISKQEGLRSGIRQLKHGLPLVYLPDMDFGARDSVFVPFFGTDAATLTAFARLAKMTGAAVVPLVTRQLSIREGYEARFYPAWENYPSGDDEADARRLNAFVEERVREMPDQYYWVHKRFGTRRPGERNLYKPSRD